MGSKVKNVSDHSVDTEPDGKVIAPGETLEDVDLDNDHNKALVESGALSEDAPEEQPKAERRAK